MPRFRNFKPLACHFLGVGFSKRWLLTPSGGAVIAEEAFAVRYKGPALQAGEMDVRDLAPALLAMAEVFQETHAMLNPTSPQISLQIRAASRGSVVVDLVIHLPDAIAALALPAPEMVKQVLEGFKALFELVKMMRGRKAEDIEQRLSPGEVNFIDKETSLSVRAGIFELSKNAKVRKQMSRVVEPVRREGIEQLEVLSGGRLLVKVNKQDAPYFDPPAPAPALPPTSTEEERLVTLESVEFKEGNRWDLTDGNASFSAKIADESFLSEVDAGEAFRKGDQLRCRVLIEQSVDGKGQLHASYTVTQVFQHVRRPEQDSLWS